MRELKFRAWNKRIKKWHETELPFVGFSLFGECTLVCPPRIEDLGHLEITQFTGLKDKHGKDLYEGDIVQGFRGTQKFKSDIYFIKYSEQSFVMAANKDDEKMDCIWFFDFEIIGNIYEHPNLIKPI